MRVFKHPNTGHDWTCPICSTNTDRPVTLISRSGTREGNKVQADQFHVDCIELESGPLDDRDPHLIAIYTAPFRLQEKSVAGKRYLSWTEYLSYSIELAPDDPDDHDEAYDAIVGDGRIKSITPHNDGVSDLAIEEYLP